MKKLPIVLLIAAAQFILVGEGTAQLAKYFDRSIEQRFTVMTGASVPLGSFVQKNAIDPNAGYANMAIMGGLEYTALPLNGGIGLTASALVNSYSVSMLPGGATANRYFLLSLMAGPRFEMAISSLTPISLYSHGQIGALFSQSPDITINSITSNGNSDLTFVASVGAGAVFDRVIDVGVRYFYTEASFGENRLSSDAVTHIEGLQATVGFLIF
ncbi:MAG: hypothetical protein ACKVRP_13245 [Bacteroidota bacterium]